MFSLKPQPNRPAKFTATCTPDDILPAAVIMFDDRNRAAVKQLLGNLSPQTINAFIEAHSKSGYKTIGQAYAAYDGALPDDPVAQLWERNEQAGSLLAIRRIGNGRFRVQADEGVNALVLYKSDARQPIKKPAALLCVTLPGKPSQFMKVGDASVFEGAVFRPQPLAAAEFQHMKDHILRQCSHCTAGKEAFAKPLL